jgi:hypothetical protein
MSGKGFEEKNLTLKVINDIIIFQVFVCYKKIFIHMIGMSYKTYSRKHIVHTWHVYVALQHGR